MADKRISDLDPIQNLLDAALLVAEQGGFSGKITAAQVKALAQQAADAAAQSAQSAALAASRYPRINATTYTWEVWDPLDRVWTDTGISAANVTAENVSAAGAVMKSAQSTKTSAHTEPVGVDASGKLWSIPGSGGGGAGTWSQLAGKPFERIGDTLAVADGTLDVNIHEVSNDAGGLTTVIG